MNSEPLVLTPVQRFLKRSIDLFGAIVGIFFLWPIMLIGWCAATLSTGQNGLFIQQRVGRHGELFKLLKLRSMKSASHTTTTVTAKTDARITRVGQVLRKLKIDELPQLLNVAAGHMSLVGPRPDVPGFADRLEGPDRAILSIRPGITGPASIHFRNEEDLLAEQSDPERYNREVIWPKKIEINLEYLKHQSALSDLKYIWQTVFRP